jgi:hypothetical protein
MQAFSLPCCKFYYTDVAHDCKDQPLHLECFKSRRWFDCDFFVPATCSLWRRGDLKARRTRVYSPAHGLKKESGMQKGGADFSRKSHFKVFRIA